MPKRSETQTNRTRSDILAKAIDVASVEGLGGLSLGRLADAVSMSKSGLFAHFGSIEALQAAVLERAREVFECEVLAGAGDADAGLPRLALLASRWLGYVEKGHFRGGCFFAAASLELDDRPGRLRDRVAALTSDWMRALENAAEEAIEAGHLGPDSEAAQLAFEIHAFVQEANRAFQLHGEAEAFRRARRAIGRTLAAAATAEGRVLLHRTGSAQ